MSSRSKGDRGHAVTGRLTLVATPIGNLGDLSQRAIGVLRAVDVIACEDTRRTRALLTSFDIPGGRRLRALHAHNERTASARLVEELRAGTNAAYVSDAGTPGISDPGERLVRACLDAEIEVDAVPGPSALVTALVLSGLPTERFCFEGFLPRKGAARTTRLGVIAAEHRTTVVFESPARVEATVAELADVCGADRPLAIARELTKIHQEVWRGSMAEAVARLASTEPRGEHVLVIGGTEIVDVDDAMVAAAVGDALDRGLSARDAAMEVAEDLGVGRRRAYELALTRRSR